MSKQIQRKRSKMARRTMRTMEDVQSDPKSIPKADGVNFSEDRLFPVGWGLIFRCVCVPKSWSDGRIADDLSAKDPPGTSANRWEVSTPDDDRTDVFQGVNRVQCPDCVDRWHVLCNC